MAIDFNAWHDRTAASHKQMLDQHAALGYQTVSLSIYGEVADPRFAAVVVRRSTRMPQRQFTGMNYATFKQKFDEQAAQGWGPMIVTATGSATAPLIAAVFRPMSPNPFTRPGLTATELRTLNAQAMQQGTILQSVDAYGTPADTRYIAVWHPKTTSEAWNADGVNDDLATAQNRFNAQVAAGFRPLNLAITPSLGMLVVYGNSTIGPWVMRMNMTSAEYQAEFDKYFAQGMAPLRLAAQGTGAGARFAAIWTTREEVDAITGSKPYRPPTLG
jgi:hypothetical protein